MHFNKFNGLNNINRNFCNFSFNFNLYHASLFTKHSNLNPVLRRHHQFCVQYHAFRPFSKLENDFNSTLVKRNNRGRTNFILGYHTNLKRTEHLKNLKFHNNSHVVAIISNSKNRTFSTRFKVQRSLISFILIF